MQKVQQHMVEGLPEVVSQLADIVHQAPAPNGVDDTQALKDFFSLGYKNVQLKGTYRINLVEGQSLATFTNTDNIRIFGQDAKILDLKTNYTHNAALTPVFKFENCKNITVDLDFEGQPLANPTADLGYKGATFTYFLSGCVGIKVKGTHKHCRHSVLSGVYTDETKGYCKTFDIDLITDFVGYSVALYLAEDVTAKLYATNTHRTAYMGGVKNGRVDAKFKNQYLAAVQVLLTDAKTGVGTSRGCSNVDVKAYDLGSTQTPDVSFCAGISLSRVDPNTVFENLSFDVYVKSTDTVAAKVGAFYIVSGAKTYEPSYPYNWESSIIIRNIKVKGVIDKSAQTIANGTNGDLYFSTTDSGRSGTLSNISFEDLIIKSGASPNGISLDLTGLQDQAVFSNVVIENVPVTINSNSNSVVTFRNAVIDTLSIFGKYTCIDSKIGTLNDTANNGSFFNSFVNNGKIGFKLMKRELTLSSGTTATFPVAIPRGALLLDVHTLVTQAVTGATSLDVGVAGTANLFAWGIPTTLGTKTSATGGSGAALTPKLYTANTDLVVTGNAAFTGGKVLIMVWYIELITPSV